MTSFSGVFLNTLFRTESLTTQFSFLNNYSLVSTINHSDNLNIGHDWAFKKHGTANQWFSCSDKVVFQVDNDDLNNKTSHVLCFVKK